MASIPTKWVPRACVIHEKNTSLFYSAAVPYISVNCPNQTIYNISCLKTVLLTYCVYFANDLVGTNSGLGTVLPNHVNLCLISNHMYTRRHLTFHTCTQVNFVCDFFRCLGSDLKGKTHEYDEGLGENLYFSPYFCMHACRLLFKSNGIFFQTQKIWCLHFVYGLEKL